YRLRFSVQSNIHGIMRAGAKGATQFAGPEVIYERNIPFDTQRRDMEIYFQSGLTDQAVTQFTNSVSEPQYWLDNVDLRRVEVEPLDPLEKQQLFINDQPTEQTMDLTGCWSDVFGNFHSGSIVLPAFSSIVMVRESDGSCINTGLEPGQEGTGSNTMRLVHPNPVLAGGSLDFNTPPSFHWTLKAFDLDGKLVWSEEQGAGNGSIPVPARLEKGTYLLLLNDGDQILRQKLMVL
ncbi:MAG: T9SS type A sorting domain-containing protein, partial [Flavobacteriales bacterium]